ncbi:MAG: ATP-binding protein [bacterium]|nr:ATP-binding protein [bacterium]
MDALPIINLIFRGPFSRLRQYFVDSQDFRIVASFGVTLCGFLLVVPFAVNGFVQGRYLLACGASAVALTGVQHLRDCVRGNYQSGWYMYGLVPMEVLYLSFALYKQGVLATYWSYPAIISFYVVLPERPAWVVNGLFIAVFFPQVATQIEASLATRYFATFIGVNFFLIIFVRVIENRQQALKKQALDLQSALQQVEESHQELVRTQQQMVHSAKMASLGVLVAGVAHEINNPTCAMQFNVFNLGRELSELKEYLFGMIDDSSDPVVIQSFEARFAKLIGQTGTLVTSTERIKNLVTDLRSFSRLDDSPAQWADPVADLDRSVRLLRTQYKDQVEIFCQLDDRPQIFCRPDQLNQVYMNLMINACQAVVATGKPGMLKLTSRADPQYWVLSIEDEGCGMSPTIQEQMFDPFFTTKDVGEGTGLGLSISFGIIEKHQGYFEVISNQGQGTKISIFLPLQSTVSVAEKKI